MCDSCSHFEREVNRLRDQLCQTIEENEGLRETVQYLSSVQSSLQQQKVALAERATYEASLQNLKSSAEENVTALQTELSQVTHKLQDEQNSNTALRSQIEDSREQLREWRARVMELERDLVMKDSFAKEKETHISLLEESRSSQKERIEVLERILAECDATRGNQRTSNAAVEMVVQTLQRRVLELESEVKKLTGAHKELHTLKASVVESERLEKESCKVVEALTSKGRELFDLATEKSFEVMLRDSTESVSGGPSRRPTASLWDVLHRSTTALRTLEKQVSDFGRQSDVHVRPEIKLVSDVVLCCVCLRLALNDYCRVLWNPTT
eukprot:PhM_4_TR12705/c0_g1_i1/m.94049